MHCLRLDNSISYRYWSKSETYSSAFDLWYTLQSNNHKSDVGCILIPLFYSDSENFSTPVLFEIYCTDDQSSFVRLMSIHRRATSVYNSVSTSVQDCIQMYAVSKSISCAYLLQINFQIFLFYKTAFRFVNYVVAKLSYTEALLNFHSCFILFNHLSFNRLIVQ